MSEIQFTKKTKKTFKKSGWRHNHVGGNGNEEKIIARGTCPYCNSKAAFRQIGKGKNSEKNGPMVAVRCDGCHSIMSISVNDQKIYPAPKLKNTLEKLSEEEDLPDTIQDIKKYYEEGIRCIGANAPNGAATLFRKTIHAIAVHYDIVKRDEHKGIRDMIDELEEKGHINPKLNTGLNAVQNIGNDGAHINKNEPDIEQAKSLKQLIDAVLESTILADRRIKYAKEQHNTES